MDQIRSSDVLRCQTHGMAGCCGVGRDFDVPLSGSDSTHDLSLKQRVMSRIDETASAVRPAVERTRAAVDDQVGRAGAATRAAVEKAKLKGRQVADRSVSYMRANPMKLTAMATGIGLAAGLAGRLLKSRLKHREVLVIESVAAGYC